MKCPKCSFDKSAVIESRPFEGQVYRRRTCNMCNHLFKSLESPFDGPIPRTRERPEKPEKIGAYNTKTLAQVWK